jgi:hypothetical protein
VCEGELLSSSYDDSDQEVTMQLVEQWQRLLRENAAGYARVALENIDREFPSHVAHLMRDVGDLPVRPRARTPIFYGSFDWHSCVEMHWLLVRLLRTVPDTVPEDEIRDALEVQFSEEGVNGEVGFVTGPDGRGERPYGWGWALQLIADLTAWDDADGRRWRERLEPLAAALEDGFLTWLPKATYPVRGGLHANSAFGLSLTLDHARQRAAAGDSRLLDAVTTTAHRWFREDADYPGAWEPSGTDFLSPALTEAELMARLLPGTRFPRWLGRFLPGVVRGEPATLFHPAVVSDASEGQIAHLHGLNASRAWCWRRIAEHLPAGDPRLEPIEEGARRLADAALPHVVGDDYMVEHWLPAYAVLLMS